jgi:hypothetical protein
MAPEIAMAFKPAVRESLGNTGAALFAGTNAATGSTQRNKKNRMVFFISTEKIVWTIRYIDDELNLVVGGTRHGRTVV